MGLDAIRLSLERLRRPGIDPRTRLVGIGSVTADSVGLISAETTRLPLRTGPNIPGKSYEVVVRGADSIPFSRPLNSELFIWDTAGFIAQWDHYLRAIDRARRSGSPVLTDIGGDEIDRVCYTAAMAFAALIDLFSRGDRGGPGTAFQLTVGATLAYLLDKPLSGAVDLTVPGGGRERVNVDITIGDPNLPPVLAVPTKLTTRERIAEAYVHQHVLDAARPGVYRGVLCVCSENNVIAPKRTPNHGRTPDVCWVQDTLVPGTIALYERYMAHIRIYYLDPPPPYISSAHPGLPPIGWYSTLLLEDLESLVS